MLFHSFKLKVREKTTFAFVMFVTFSLHCCYTNNCIYYFNDPIRKRQLD